MAHPSHPSHKHIATILLGPKQPANDCSQRQDAPVRAGIYPAPRHERVVDTVKTGVGRELPPQDPDCFHICCASIACHVYLRKRVDVNHLSKKHETAENRGTRPSKHIDASVFVIRRALQAIEKLGVVEHDEETDGQRITATGQRYLNCIAQMVLEDAENGDESD